MKRILTLLLAFAAVLFCTAASAPTVSEQLVRIQTDPASGRVDAFFERTVVIDSTAYKQPWRQISWEIGAEKSVTVGGKTLTYAEVLAAVVAIAEQERAAADAPPAP